MKEIIIWLLILLPVTLKADDVTSTVKWIDSHYPYHPKMNTQKVASLIHLYSKKHRISVRSVLNLIGKESSFNQRAISRRGAVGLMQVRQSVHQDKLNGRNPYNPAVNIQVGMTILSDCIKNSYSRTGALQCYNGAGYRRRK